MKRPGFFHGVAAAAVLGFAASAVIAVLTPLLGLGTVIRLLIPGLALAYILYLFSRNEEKTGRATTLALWAAMSLVAWWFAVPLPFYLLMHAAAIWLVRSLYFYSGVVPSLLDMGLTGVSIVTSIWALSRTGSVFLGTWCFFLVQALFAAIPQSLTKRPRIPQPASDDGFDRARRQADTALKQLISQ
ncbi:MAG: hypothetical protein OEW68_00540 [Gammaproteobacteria bacterium]|nr:hypothetical protein [Gammaproteobacteria bacterium]MDH4313311.1 hypothetical protein [Gammaproteobacteria bacterium]MDH5214682.1 hypothetical protein [Gammaproteobacteria bacterium]